MARCASVPTQLSVAGSPTPPRRRTALALRPAECRATLHTVHRLPNDVGRWEGSPMKVLVVLALLLVPGIALALPKITFDTTPGGAGGTLVYGGAGGPLVGAGIVFVEIQGTDTPLNNLDVLDCVGCTPAFTTGANLVA